MSIAALVIGCYAVFVICWILYLAIMNLARVRQDLHPFAKFNAYVVVLPIGYAFDVVLNLLVCAIFMRWPRDWLLTGTLKRTINTDNGWRCTFSSAVCQYLLNPFDPSGKHC